MTNMQQLRQYFKLELYNCLKFPPFLKIAMVKNKQDRDVALLSALTMVSATLPNYYGYWRGDQFSPHLYTFFVGKSGSSKSHATNLLPCILEINEGKLQRYENQLADYKQQLALCKGNESAMLKHPKRCKLLLSAKTTEAAFFKDFKVAEEYGCLLASSEADMFGGSMKGDYGGGLSEVLRQSFQHEFIDKSLSGDNADVTKHYFIKKPRLAVLFAGTPGQVKRMMGNHVENGLLNRFMFYNTELKGECISKSSNITAGLLLELKDNVKKMYNDLFERTNPLTFELPDPIADELVDFFEPLRAKYAKIAPIYNTLVKRMCLSAFRLMMIFTALRNRHLLAGGDKIVCNEDDFFKAQAIAEVVIKHSVRVNQQFIAEEQVFKPTAIIILDKMPEIFGYMEFVRMASGQGAADRTGEKWITKLVQKNLIKKREDGTYTKI